MTIARLATCVFMFLLAQCAVSATTAAQTAESILKRVPHDAEAVVAVGGLRSASDQIEQWLEGMNRTELLFGSRPLDQAKSALGMGVAVDELAGAAVFIVRTDDDALRAVWMLPTTDAEAFFKGNFDRIDDTEITDELPCDDASMFQHRWLGEVATRAFDGYVLLSRDANVLCTYKPGEGIHARINALTENRLHAMVEPGDVLVYAKQDALATMAPKFIAQLLPEFAGTISPEAAQRIVASDSLDSFLLVIDFDPLALFLRSIVTLEPESDLAEAVRSAQARGRGLQHLPHRPYFAAMTVDIDGLGGDRALETLQRITSSQIILPLVREMNVTQATFFAEDAGTRGGLLQRGSLLLHTQQPNTALDAFREAITTNAFGRDGTWHEPSELPGIGTIETFSVLPAAHDHPLLQIMIGPLLGGEAWNGAAITTDDAFALTFSRGRAVIEQVVERADGIDPSLNRNMVVRSMRGFLPASPQFELYIDAGRASGAFQPLFEAWSRITGARVRSIPRDLPPIAYGVSTRSGGYEHGLIIPAGVFAVVLDQLREHVVQQRLLQPRENDGNENRNSPVDAAER